MITRIRKGNCYIRNYPHASQEDLDEVEEPDVDKHGKEKKQKSAKTSLPSEFIFTVLLGVLLAICI